MENKNIIHKKYLEVHLYLKAMEKARIQFEESNDPVDLKIYRTLEDDFECITEEEFREIQEEVMRKKQEQIKEKERQMAEAQSREQMSSTVSS